MPREKSPGAPRAADFRPRRSHEKSRTGCIRCKQQRKKCDETRPDCSRCTKHLYCCRYPQAQNGLDVAEEPTLIEAPRFDMLDSPPSIVFSASGMSLAPSDGMLSVASSSPISLSSSHPGFSENEESPQLQSPTPSVLNATELELLSHYLTHTSHTVAFDDDDLYALSVGIPNIAFGSKPVMSSMLALAAACKSNHIAKEVHVSTDGLDEMRELLVLADRHHRGSLEQIQTALCNTSSYDSILANAALMVLYSSASHCVRVALAEAAMESGGELPGEIMPQGSQWISLIRAAHTASTSVLSTVADISGEISADGPTGFSRVSPDHPRVASYGRKALSPQDGPSEGTRRLFLPILSSSYCRALERLHERVQSTVAKSAWHQAELQTCMATLPVLDNVALTSLSTSKAGEGNIHERRESESIPFDRLSKVSPWLGRYLARVTSLTSPKPLRRTIMSFLNQAPLEYLSIVQSVLDAPPIEANTKDRMSCGKGEDRALQLSVTQLLAMDIFAHWLVLVMLLDGVWWIGGIGQWELGHVVSLIKSQNSLHHYLEGSEAWWPESMYRLKRELMQHI